jgi:hypothetical protein
MYLTIIVLKTFVFNVNSLFYKSLIVLCIEG